MLGGVPFQVRSRLFRLQAGLLNVSGEAFVFMSRNTCSRCCDSVQCRAKRSHRLQVAVEKFSVFFTNLGSPDVALLLRRFQNC